MNNLIKKLLTSKRIRTKKIKRSDMPDSAGAPWDSI